MVLSVSKTIDEVGIDVCQLIVDLSKRAIAKNDRFTVAFSGGSLPKVKRRPRFERLHCRYIW